MQKRTWLHEEIAAFLDLFLFTDNTQTISELHQGMSYVEVTWEAAWVHMPCRWMQQSPHVTSHESQVGQLGLYQYSFVIKLPSFPCRVVVVFLHCVLQILMTGCRVICKKK